MVRALLCLFLTFCTISEVCSQDFSKFYGSWEGDAEVRVKGAAAKGTSKVSFSRFDKESGFLLGTMEVFNLTQTTPYRKIEVKIALNEVKMEENGFSFPAQGLSAKNKAVPGRNVYRVSKLNGKSILLIYFRPDDNKIDQVYGTMNFKLYYVGSDSDSAKENGETIAEVKTETRPESVSPLTEEVSFAVQLSEGAALLFKNLKSNLAINDKNIIFDALGFKLSKNKKQFIADEGAADDPFSATVYLVDLNGDEVEEVFVSYGNVYTSAITGVQIALFTRTTQGADYTKCLDMPGLIPDIIPAYRLKYPDLLVGGRGFSFPVYSWNGRKYIPNGEISDSAMGKVKLISVEKLSDLYQAKGYQASRNLQIAAGSIPITYSRK